MRIGPRSSFARSGAAGGMHAEAGAPRPTQATCHFSTGGFGARAAGSADLIVRARVAEHELLQWNEVDHAAALQRPDPRGRTRKLDARSVEDGESVPSRGRVGRVKFVRHRVEHLLELRV